jgi:putative pyruvate formate lyase activating enzyme
MDQYRPCYRADEYPELDRPITRAEYAETLELAEHFGLRRLDGRAPRRRVLEMRAAT